MATSSSLFANRFMIAVMAAKRAGYRPCHIQRDNPAEAKGKNDRTNREVAGEPIAPDGRFVDLASVLLNSLPTIASNAC